MNPTEAIAVVLIVGMVVGVPLFGITVRLALKPLVDAYLRMREAHLAHGEVAALRARVQHLEHLVESQGAALARAHLTRLRRIASMTTTADAAPGSTCPSTRSPSRSARPLPASIPFVASAPSRAAATAAPRHPARPSPAACAFPAASAAGAQASSMVFCPGSAFPRSRIPTAIACSMATTSASSSAAFPFTTAPARISAVA